MPDYENVLASLYGRLETFKADADVVRFQLSARFLGGEKETAEVIIQALQAVVDDAHTDMAMAEVQF